MPRNFYTFIVGACFLQLLCAGVGWADVATPQQGDPVPVHVIMEMLPGNGSSSNAVSGDRVVQGVECTSPDANNIVICREKELIHE